MYDIPRRTTAFIGLQKVCRKFGRSRGFPRD